ncbi:MAG: AMP-binding protein, partial [Clostridia bacterium]|nr:AMP-binding protein [Clostridia bacterium]
VPTMFIAMLSHPDFEKTDFSHMRTGIMAGANCPESVMREAAKRMNMTGIVSVYGQTEAAPGCTMSRCYEDSLDVRTQTVGCALPEIECRIIDPATGKELPDGEQGEFVARGYNIMKGYYKMPSATYEAIDREGWLHTGDLCIRDKDGNYRVTGRLKDMIIRGGENIYPREIEEFLITHDKISDVQVIGVPDKQYGEEIMACVIVREGEEMTEEDVKAYVRANMARHKVPKYVWFVDKFIMNDAGKIQKYKMREKAAEIFGLSNQ